MPDPHWENLKEIFHAAIALPANERVAFLDKASGGDLSLRRAVESLLKSHAETANFVDTPAYQAAADMLVQGDELKTGPEDSKLHRTPESGRTAGNKDCLLNISVHRVILPSNSINVPN